MSRRSIFKVQSSVSPALMRYTILKGTLIASLGGFLLVYCGGFIPPSSLSRWGIFIWTAGFALIAYGLIPYKSLLRLMTKPNEIIFDDRGQMHYMSQGKHQFMVPVRMIEQINYVEGKLKYGIKFAIHEEKRKTVFLPYFSKRTYKKIQEAIHEIC